MNRYRRSSVFFVLLTFSTLLPAMLVAQQSVVNSPAGSPPRSAAGGPSAAAAGRTVSLKGFSLQALAEELAWFMPRSSFGGGGGDTGGANASFGGGFAGAPGAVVADEKLFLTRDQVVKLIPLVQELVRNPYPTPSTARQIVGSMDSILSANQTQAYSAFQAEVEKQRAETAKTIANSSPAELAAKLESMSGEERRQFFQSMTPEQRAALAQAGGFSNGLAGRTGGAPGGALGGFGGFPGAGGPPPDFAGGGFGGGGFAGGQSSGASRSTRSRQATSSTDSGAVDAAEQLRVLIMTGLERRMQLYLSQLGS